MKIRAVLAALATKPFEAMNISTFFASSSSISLISINVDYSAIKTEIHGSLAKIRSTS